jgi:hypothetical protein
MKRPAKSAKPKPPHRPRLDPDVVREAKTYRLRPDTIQRIEAEAERQDESTGQVVDRLARRLPLPPG